MKPLIMSLIVYEVMAVDKQVSNNIPELSSLELAIDEVYKTIVF